MKYTLVDGFRREPQSGAWWGAASCLLMADCAITLPLRGQTEAGDEVYGEAALRERYVMYMVVAVSSFEANQEIEAGLRNGSISGPLSTLGSVEGTATWAGML